MALASPGSKMATASIDNQHYRYAGDDNGQVIVALVDNDLVVTLVPANPADDLLKSVLGISKPEKSMASSGELQEMAAANNFGASASSGFCLTIRSDHGTALSYCSVNRYIFANPYHAAGAVSLTFSHSFSAFLYSRREK